MKSFMMHSKDATVVTARNRIAKAAVSALLLGLSCAALLPQAAAAQDLPENSPQGTTTCALQYVGPDKVVYTQGQLQSFVDTEVRPKLSTSSTLFDITVSNICNGTQASYLTIGIDPSDFYIVRVDGVTLSDTQSTYTTANVELSLDDLQAAYTTSLTFKKQSLTNQQDAVKTLAFFFAEAARFSQIETQDANLTANTSCIMQWTNYSHLIHRWSVLSKYASHVGLVPSGAYKAGDLIAPITANIVTAYNADAAKGKNGPNEKYIDSADFDDPITVQTTCSSS
jgi:hypothetical protein